MMSSCTAFDNAKTRVLKRLDKSLKGSIDTPMLPLVESINSTEDLVSTSCCSGRISLFAGKKKTGGFVFCSHEAIHQFSDIESKISDFLASNNPVSVNFKFEPLLLHVEAASLAAADRFLSLAINSGFRNSGILSLGRRFVIAVRGCLRLEFPIIDNGELIASVEYIKRCTEIANKKLIVNLNQINDFHEIFLREYFPKTSPQASASPDPRFLTTLDVPEDFTSKLQFFGAAKLENSERVLVVGGQTRGPRSSRVLEFNKTSETFRDICVSKNFKPRVFAAGAYPYVFGGRTSPEKPLNDLWKFDENSNQLIEISDQISDEKPCERFRHCAASDEIGNFFVLGGVDPHGELLCDFWKFSESSGWKRLPDAPRGVRDGTMEIVGKRIFLLIGNLCEISVFDGKSWGQLLVSTGNERIIDRSAHASTADSFGIFVGGGLSNIGTILRDVWYLNTEICSWKFLGLFPEDNWRMRFCLSRISDHSLLALGGGGNAFTFGSYFDRAAKFPIPQDIAEFYVHVAEKSRIQETREYLRDRNFLDESRKIRVLKSGVYFPVLVRQISDLEVVKLPSGEAEESKAVVKISEKFERIGDVVLLPAKEAKRLQSEISSWADFCMMFKCRAVGILGERITGEKRESNNRILYATDRSEETQYSSYYTTHVENGVKYRLDLMRHMFSSGNGTERKRMRSPPGLNSDEVVVDLFAGIGYFSLPLLLSGATRLYACDWNDSALACLKESLSLNKIPDERVVISPGDSATAHERIGENLADRISLGLIPQSDIAWPAAARILKNSGGWLHVHGVAADVEIWKAEVVTAFKQLGLEISQAHVNKVKNYRPKVKHYVLDLYASRPVL